MIHLALSSRVNLSEGHKAVQCISLANRYVRWLSECFVAGISEKASFPFLNQGITKGPFSFESTLTYLCMLQYASG